MRLREALNQSAGAIGRGVVDKDYLVVVIVEVQKLG
jgi:hypothetical protein